MSLTIFLMRYDMDYGHVLFAGNIGLLKLSTKDSSLGGTGSSFSGLVRVCWITPTVHKVSGSLENMRSRLTEGIE